jgi:FkbM family methyltransferase
MDKIAKLKQAVGMIAAPIVYNLSRLTKKSRLAHLALELDPLYHRAFQFSNLSSNAKSQIWRFQIASLLTANAMPDVIPQIVELLPKSRSQFLQDIFCVLALNQMRDGFFVEVGVGSGERISNTFMLEKTFGWTGLLFEPNRMFHESIRASRTAKLDTRAVTSKTGEILTFEEFPGAGEFSRIAGAKSHDMSRIAVQRYDVDTVSLDDALFENQAPSEIDFISIDTEGSEIDILRGINFGQRRFKIIIIEHNYHQQFQDAYDQILSPHGYRRIMPTVSSVDAWYVHQDVPLRSFVEV